MHSLYTCVLKPLSEYRVFGRIQKWYEIQGILLVSNIHEPLIIVEHSEIRLSH